MDNNVLACSKMVSADTGQSIQTVADVGYPAGTSSSSGSRLRIYPQGYEGSAIQIHADTSNKGYVEGPSERMDIKMRRYKNCYKYVSYIHEAFGLSEAGIEFCEVCSSCIILRRKQL